MKDKNNVVPLIVPVMPDKKVQSLTDKELALAYGAATFLMKSGIPAMPCFDSSGVVYDGHDNVIERKIAFTWLSPKGEALVTIVRAEGGQEISHERLQTLIDGIAEQFNQAMQG